MIPKDGVEKVVFQGSKIPNTQQISLDIKSNKETLNSPLLTVIIECL